MNRRAYPVTTIGELAAPRACASGCGCGGTTGACACGSPATRSARMGALDDLTILYNPFVWVAQKLIGAGVDAATRRDSATEPSGLDRIAASLGVDPVEYAVELTGYTGLGRYWPAMQVVGGAVAIGGAAMIAARVIKSKSKRKSKRG